MAAASLDSVVVHVRMDNSMELIPSSECISHAVGQGMCHYWGPQTLSIAVTRDILCFLTKGV
jgi:hypothetical protein